MARLRPGGRWHTAPPSREWPPPAVAVRVVGATPGREGYLATDSVASRQ